MGFAKTNGCAEIRMRAALVIVFLLVGCEDAYRFPCQDPSNWQSEACHPPACEADGTCTKYLVTEQNES